MSERDDGLQFSIRARISGVRSRPVRRRTVRGKLHDRSFLAPPDTQLLFKNVTVRRVTFEGQRFFSFHSTSSLFEDCDFDRTSYEYARFAVTQPSIYRRCTFRQADLRGLDPGLARFEGCSFENARIEEWFSFCGEFVDCSFRRARVFGSKFFGRPFGPCVDNLEPPRTMNEFRGNDFRGAELIDTEFVDGINIDAQHWPEGTEYVRLRRIHERIAHVRPVVLEWADERERTEALGLLSALSTGGMERQDDLFAYRGAGMDSDVVGKVWDLLEAALPTED